MCGRYLLVSPAEAIRRWFGILGTLPNFPPRYNVAPTDTMPVVRFNVALERELALIRWGLVPGWADSLSVGSRMINTRSETVATKGAFRESFIRRRCLVPADGYYEWKVVDGQRQPYLIRPPADTLLVFAGIWEVWTRPQALETGSMRDVGPAGQLIETYSIITGPALPSIVNTHDRMPIVLEPEGFETWLDPNAAREDLDLLMAPNHVDFTVTAVGSSVNSVKNDDPNCLEPGSAIQLDQPSLF